MIRAWPAALLAIAACNDTEVQTGLTGVELAIQYPVDRGIDQLRLWGTVDGTFAFAPGVVPDQPVALTTGDDTLVVLLPDSLAPADIVIRVDGLATGVVAASGAVVVTLTPAQLVRTTIVLAAPASCGDGMITAGIEECDDGNVGSTDGCAELCFVEPGYTCSGMPSTCFTICSDGLDNDGDGAIDLADTGCVDGGDVTETCTAGAGCAECDDGDDNDGDGVTDLQDCGCNATADPVEGGACMPQCGDTNDNDGDGRIDFPDDPGCNNIDDVSEHRNSLECDDGADDDRDGLADFKLVGGDPGCADPLDDDERGNLVCDNAMDEDDDGFEDFAVDGSSDPGCTSPFDPSELGTAECDDGMDNDTDTFTDWPDDPECTSLTDGQEAP